MKNDLEHLTADFIDEVRINFSFLERYGFVLGEGSIEADISGVSVALLSSDMAFIFSIDFRESNSISCYISRVVEGEVVRFVEDGGFYHDFWGFLVDRFHYRGGIPHVDNAGQPGNRFGLGGYAILVEQYLSSLPEIYSEALKYSDSSELNEC